MNEEDHRCPDAPDGGGHHYVPTRVGAARGEPVRTMACAYCGEAMPS